MARSKRIRLLCSLIEKTDVFADVGCDHGYCTQYVLENGLCDKAIFSDVSKGSLQKAQKLLGEFVAEGRAVAVLGDGFFGVPKDVGFVLIAGMGGVETVSILSDPNYGFIPKRFLLQPMQGTDKVRKFLLENGGIIDRDFTFFDGKFYDVILGRRAVGNERQSYTETELEFGKENVQNPSKEFLELMKKRVEEIDEYLQNDTMQAENRLALEEKKKRIQGVIRQ